MAINRQRPENCCPIYLIPQTRLRPSVSLHLRRTSRPKSCNTLSVGARLSQTRCRHGPINPKLRDLNEPTSVSYEIREIGISTTKSRGKQCVQPCFGFRVS